MAEKPYDLEANHPLYPRREVLAEHEKVGFDYEETVHDRSYKEWYALVRGRDCFQEVTQIYRRRVPNEGEFLMYNVTLRGKDWKGNDQQFATLLGRYEKPIFRLEKDPQTQQVSSTQVASHKTIYDIPYTKEKVLELIEAASEPISLIVYGTAGRRLGIQSVDDYKEGALDDLIVCANSGKSLQTVLAERNQFTYEKREQKDFNQNQNQNTNTNTKKDKDRRVLDA